MNSEQVIRIIGMVIAAMFFLLATPFLLFSLQGVGGPWWASILHIVTVIAIIASFPIIFTGFIMKYKLKFFIYLITASLLLTALDIAVIRGIAPQFDYTNVVSAIIFSIPALTYLIGWHLNRSNAEKTQTA